MTTTSDDATNMIKCADLLAKMEAGTKDYIVVKSIKIRSDLAAFGEVVKYEKSNLDSLLRSIEMDIKCINCPVSVVMEQLRKLDEIAKVVVMCIEKLSILELLEKKIKPIEKSIIKSQAELSTKLQALMKSQASEKPKTLSEPPTTIFLTDSLHTDRCFPLSPISSTTCSISDCTSPYESPTMSPAVMTAVELDDLRTALENIVQ